MGLEKFDDAIAEYLETKRKYTKEALKLADLSDSDIEKYCANIEKEILGFVKCNEPYAQLLMDLEHIFSKTFNLYSLTEIAKKKNPDNPSYVIQSWLRDINTLQFLCLWEKDNNVYFIEEAAKELIEKTKQPSFTMTAKLWKKYASYRNQIETRTWRWNPCSARNSNRLYNVGISRKEIGIV